VHPEVLKKGVEENVSAASAFITNAHKELRLILKRRLSEKNIAMDNRGVPTAPFKSATELGRVCNTIIQKWLTFYWATLYVCTTLETQRQTISHHIWTTAK